MCVGDAEWFTERSVVYAKERRVFGRPIGQNQGVAFPAARACAQTRAAELMVREGCRRFDSVADRMNVPFLCFEDTAEAPRRIGLARPSICPYGAFATADGFVNDLTAFGAHPALRRVPVLVSGTFASVIAPPALGAHDGNIRREFAEASP